MNRLLFASAAIATLAACGPSPSDAPTVPPTELAAVRTPPPVYPMDLACANIGGTVTLMITIGPGRNPTDIVLSRSSGNATLDENAIAAVKGWEFKPATFNGQPVPRKIQVPVTFRPPAERPEECFQLDEKR